MSVLCVYCGNHCFCSMNSSVTQTEVRIIVLCRVLPPQFSSIDSQLARTKVRASVLQQCCFNFHTLLLKFPLSSHQPLPAASMSAQLLVCTLPVNSMTVSLYIYLITGDVQSHTDGTTTLGAMVLEIPMLKLIQWHPGYLYRKGGGLGWSGLLMNVIVLLVRT